MRTLALLLGAAVLAGCATTRQPASCDGSDLRPINVPARAGVAAGAAFASCGMPGAVARA